MKNWTRTALGIIAGAITTLVVAASPANAAGNSQIGGVGVFDVDGN